MIQRPVLSNPAVYLGKLIYPRAHTLQVPQAALLAPKYSLNHCGTNTELAAKGSITLFSKSPFLIQPPFPTTPMRVTGQHSILLSMESFLGYPAVPTYLGGGGSALRRFTFSNKICFLTDEGITPIPVVSSV